MCTLTHLNGTWRDLHQKLLIGRSLVRWLVVDPEFRCFLFTFVYIRHISTPLVYVLEQLCHGHTLVRICNVTVRNLCLSFSPEPYVLSFFSVFPNRTISLKNLTSISKRLTNFPEKIKRHVTFLWEKYQTIFLGTDRSYPFVGLKIF